MRKKFFNGKRVLALVLSLSLVMGEAAFAAPVAEIEPQEIAVTEEVVTEESAKVQETQEAVSANDAADVQADVDTGDPVAAEDVVTEEEQTEEEQTEETQGEDELEAQEAANGKLSQVIGLKGTLSYSTMTDDNGKTVARYVYTYVSPEDIYVKGKLERDVKTGFYSYGGKLYDDGYYNALRDETVLYGSSEMAVAPGTDAAAYKDVNTGFYNINGVSYRNIDSITVDGVTKLYYEPSQAVVVLGVTDSYDRTAINKKYGRYTQTLASGDPDYYEVNGKAYKQSYLSSRSFYNNGKYKYVWYVNASNAIAFDKMKVNMNWYSLTNPNLNLDKYEPNSSVYYEVKVNGQDYTYNMGRAYDASGVLHYYTGSTGFTLSSALGAGESVKVQVRGVYGHKVYKQVTDENGDPDGGDITVIDGVGPWSEEYTYTIPTRTAVPAVTGLTATKMDGNADAIRVKWNALTQANEYAVYVIDSKKPISMTAADFSKYDSWDYDFLQSKGLTITDITTGSVTTGTTETDWYYTPDYQYHYFAVVPKNVADSDKYYNDQSLTTITAFAAVQTAAEPAVYTPALTGFKVEKQSDGTFDFVWDKVDAQVLIYAYDQSSFPKMYQYKKFDSEVYRNLYSVDANGNIIKDAAGKPQVYDKVSLATDMSSYNTYYDNALGGNVTNISKDYVAYNKVKCYATDGNSGRYENVISKMSLTAGKTYYFIARTYDEDEEFSAAEKTPVSYSYTGRYKDRQDMQKTATINCTYTYYPTLGPATNVVSLKAKLAKPTVRTMSAKNSVKLTMSSGLGTGYEIYRKVGKKYKKIATTTSNVYLDEGLKANTSYSYKVRSYSYNRDTKQTFYGQYRTVTAKTIAGAELDLHAFKASKTSVKLKWTKVPNAVKYEVYRTDLSNADPTIISKKFSAAGFKTYMSSTSYKLLKTITKAKTTTYTDKKLSTEEGYTYMVVAYFKDGKTTQILMGQDYVYMDLQTPQNVQAVNKGNKVVITWDADKYAAGYEVEYKVRDKYGYNKTNEPIKKTTKKATLTISGLETGGNVSFRVRAYNKSKEYSDWYGYYSTEDVPLAAVKGITAKTVTTKDGRQVVKISWKKVSGAKYYKVYRSTQMGTYDADLKTYAVAGTTIAKESNDNFQATDSLSTRSTGSRTNDNVSYKEYEGVPNSIVGTSAYDYADLAGGVTYYYTVRAYGEVPSGGTDSYVYSVQCSKPAAVTAKAALNVKATSKKGKVTLKWTKIEGASGVKYTIYRSTKAKGKYTKIGTTKKTSFTDKKSKKGKTYYYKVEVSSGKSALKSDISVISAPKKVKAK